MFKKKSTDLRTFLYCAENAIYEEDTIPPRWLQTADRHRAPTGVIVINDSEKLITNHRPCPFANAR